MKCNLTNVCVVKRAEDTFLDGLILMHFPLQMLLFLFYATPLLAIFAYGLWTPGCTWMLDWTVYFAGAMAQVIGLNYVSGNQTHLWAWEVGVPLF